MRPDNARSTAARRPAPRRRGPAGSGQRPASGRGPRGGQPSELDRALAAALATPAPAATTFRELGLPGPLVTALAERGIEEPFAIQARALPDALAGRDVLGRAQTGSGKTLAFGLPMLARLASAGARRQAGAPRALVLVPTRELAKQVADVLGPLGEPLGVSVTTVYGGAPMGRQIDRLRQGVDIVVATPGRLIDLLGRGSCRLGQVEIAVLDEADHMADLGFLPAVTRILDETPPGGQRLLFSATLDRDVDRLVTAYLASPALHAVAPVADVATAADHQVFILPAAGKLDVAAELAGRPDRTLFFVRTKHGAARLAKQLTRAGMPAAAIHGNLNQNQRQRALDGFAAGHPRVLVATDVAARGLHIDDVGLVVHFDPPNDHKDYLHRSGRTARAGASGTVVALVDPAQLGDVARLHDAAGITPSSHHVSAGHAAVREVATSGTPVPPPPPAAPTAARARATAGAVRAGGQGYRAAPARKAGPARDDAGRDEAGRAGTAQPGAALSGSTWAAARDTGSGSTQTRSAGSRGTGSPGSRHPESRSAGSRPPESRSAGSRHPESRSAGSRHPESRSAGSRGTGTRSPGSRNPEKSSAGSRPPESRSAGSRGIGTRSPESRSPEARSPEARSPESRGTGTRSPGSRSPENRSAGTRGTGTRRTGSGGTGTRGMGSLSAQGRDAGSRGSGSQSSPGGSSYATGGSRRAAGGNRAAGNGRPRRAGGYRRAS